jgi:ABC-2 type transport system permease protein/lipopolysaccharide transport system permease protein
MLSKATKDLKLGLSLYYVWVYQAYHDITAKYKRTVLGSLWIAGGMVITSVSLAIIFGALFHQNIRDTLPYVMSGMLIFGMVAYVFYDGAEMFMTSGGIIKNHAYPFTYYAFHTICKSFFLFLHNLIVYWIFAAVLGVLTMPNWSIFPALLVILLFMFTWGMLAGMLASRFRDMRFMLPYLGQLFSMLTPIFWRTDTLPPKILMVVNLNPVYALIQIARAPLLGQVASQGLWLIALGYTGLGLLLWIIVFSTLRRRIPFWV